MSKILAKCIRKIKDSKGVTKTYVLSDKNGKTLQFTSYQIKQLIKEGKLEVVNLQIDTLGRLVDKAAPVKQPVKPVAPVKNDDLVNKVIKAYLDASKRDKSVAVGIDLTDSSVIAIEDEPVIKISLHVLDKALKNKGYHLWYFYLGENSENAFMAITKHGDTKSALAFRDEAIDYMIDDFETLINNHDEVNTMDYDEDDVYLRQLKDRDWVDLHLEEEWHRFTTFDGELQVCNYKCLPALEVGKKIIEKDTYDEARDRLEAVTDIIDFLNENHTNTATIEVYPKGNCIDVKIDKDTELHICKYHAIFDPGFLEFWSLRKYFNVLGYDYVSYDNATGRFSIKRK